METTQINTNLVSDIESPDNQNSQFLNIEHQIQNIKEDLEKIIHSNFTASSILNKIAHFWGNRALWQKIIAGLILTGILLITGVCAHIISLIAISCVTAMFYMLFSLLLDNHNKLQIDFEKSFRESIVPIADILGDVIKSLNNAVTEINKSINNLKTENETYYLNNQTLHNLNNNLETEIKELKVANIVFKRLADEFSQLYLVDQKQRTQFIEKLNSFLNDNEKNITDLFERFTKAEDKLFEITNELSLSNSRYEELLKQHQILLDQLKNTIHELQALKDNQPPKSTISVLTIPNLSNSKHIFLNNRESCTNLTHDSVQREISF